MHEFSDVDIFIFKKFFFSKVSFIFIFMIFIFIVCAVKLNSKNWKCIIAYKSCCHTMMAFWAFNRGIMEKFFPSLLSIGVLTALIDYGREICGSFEFFWLGGKDVSMQYTVKWKTWLINFYLKGSFAFKNLNESMVGLIFKVDTVKLLIFQNQGRKMMNLSSSNADSTRTYLWSPD